MKNITALAMPCFVITRVKEDILKVNNGSPGLKMLNNAGSAIQRENTGINNQVRFKKNKISIEEM